MKPINLILILLLCLIFFGLEPVSTVIPAIRRTAERPESEGYSVVRFPTSGNDSAASFDHYDYYGGVRSPHSTPNSCGGDSPKSTPDCRGVRPDAPAENDCEPQTSAVIPVSRTADPESNHAIYYHPWLENPPYDGQVPLYKSEMQGPLPPNQGTDDYIILFNAVGPNENSMLGRYLCLAGDQNDDGFDDILAGCLDPPEVRLYFGGDPMDTIPDLIFPRPEEGTWFGIMPTELADLNGDGDTDIVISCAFGNTYDEVYVYFGGEVLDNLVDYTMVSDQGSSTGFEGFGYFMSTGNVNGDNNADLIVGAPNYHVNSGNGKIFLYFGGIDTDTIPDFTITSGYGGYGGTFGMNVSVAGDINKDYKNDILCWWNRATNPYYDTGCYLFYGSENLDSIPDWSYSLPYGPYNLLFSGIIQDLNGDGYDEIAVVTAYETIYQTHIFFGADSLPDEPDWIYSGGGFGPPKVKSCGDVNADGYGDMIMGNQPGNYVRVFFGGNPMNVGPDITFWLNDAGYDVGFAGDVNNDSIHDFMFSVVDFYNPTSGEIFIYSDPSLTPHVEPRFEDKCPFSFTLQQNFPNPFNSVTIIPFQSNKTGNIKLNIYNILGQSVYFTEYFCTYGEYVRVLWNGKDVSGNPLPSGLYLAELSARDCRETIKMEIIR